MSLMGGMIGSSARRRSAGATGISVVETGTRNGGSQYNYTFTETLEENDLVVTSRAADLNGIGAFVTPGYVTLIQDNGAGPSYDISYKVQGASPDTNVVVNRIGNGGPFLVYVLRGVDPASPIDVAALATGGSLTTFPAQTTLTDGAFACGWSFLDDDNETATVDGPVDLEVQSPGGLPNAQSASALAVGKLVPVAGPANLPTYSWSNPDGGRFVSVVWKPA